MHKDFFNEAIITAMLAALCSDVQSEEVKETEATEDTEGNDSVGYTNLLRKKAQVVWHHSEDNKVSDVSVLRKRLVYLMDKAEKAGIVAGVPKEYVTMADFAICAFIDEILLSSPVWTGRLTWMASSLQFMRHNTTTAGEDFFSVLETLLAPYEAPSLSLHDSHEQSTSLALHTAQATSVPVPKKVPSEAELSTLEVFALCLGQGFVGMYYEQPKAISHYLERIGNIVPSVKLTEEPFFERDAMKGTSQRVQRRVHGIFQSFDMLDYALWIFPIVVLLTMYGVLHADLDYIVQSIVGAH